jgi:hypothetical protein
MNFAPILAAFVLIGATVAQLLGVDVLPGEQTSLVENGTLAVTGLLGVYATLKAIKARRDAPPAPPAE